MTDFHKVSEGILGEETTEKTNTELFLSLVGQYFPEAIKDGEVDFTALKEEMGEFPQVSSEHYDFTWAGKQAAKKEAMSDIYGRTLKYKPQDSLNPDTTENIYIEGDNLEALKLLRRNYHGKIKMIYIDPPYNTGSDFVYHDDFSMNEEELAKISGNMIDEVRYQKNGKDNSKYHTNWLNMMYPRLKVARELLSDDGVIFISIDDHEIDSLKNICNEIYGENNLVAEIPWQSRASIQNDTDFSVNHEYICVYAKCRRQTNRRLKESNYREWHKKDSFVCKPLPLDKSKFDNPDNDPRGLWKADPFDAPNVRPNLTYVVTNPLTGEQHLPPSGRCWRISPEKFSSALADGRIIFGKNGTGRPQMKSYYEEKKEFGSVDNSWFSAERIGTTTNGTKEVMQLFDGNPFFDKPKPTSLLFKLIDLANVDEGDIVLDFFSGSATTAHAVMQLNSEDGANRKFIMVQLPEVCDEKSEAAKAGYHTICEIGKERIRRAAKKIHEDNPDAQFDDGFKVFEVADTNIRWNTADDEEIQKLDETDYGNDKERIDFTKGYTDIDVVYEIMLRQFDIPLSTPIEKMPQVSDRTYIFADAVVVCLEPEITTELIEKLAAIEPTPAKFVLRDSAFNDDIQLKDVSFRRLSALIKNHQTEEERKSKYNNYTVEFI